MKNEFRDLLQKENLKYIKLSSIQNEKRISWLATKRKLEIYQIVINSEWKNRYQDEGRLPVRNTTTVGVLILMPNEKPVILKTKSIRYALRFYLDNNPQLWFNI